MRDAVPQAEMCVCVCVCVPARRTPKRTGKLHFELRAHPNDQIHTKYVQMAGYESIHLNIVMSKWARTVGRKSDVCQYIILK